MWIWEPKIMAIEEKLLRCDFSFSNYDKDLTMTLSLLFLLRASALFIHMKDIFFACIQSSLQSTDFYGLLARTQWLKIIKKVSSVITICILPLPFEC